MQYDSNKIGFNNYGNVYGNQYTPMNQPPLGAGGNYPPNNLPPPPPPYAQYPQQPPSYVTPGVVYHSSTSAYPQQGIAVVPVYRPIWNNLQATPITSSLKTFLVISGILYILWGMSTIGLEISIIRYSYWRYYTGFWTGGFLIGGGISMLTTGCRTTYVLTHLIRMFIVCLLLCVLALILSIVNVVRSPRCDSFYWYFCDFAFTFNIKIAILIIFAIAGIHTIINIIVVNNARKVPTRSTVN